jgi:hypothetical protein
VEWIKADLYASVRSTTTLSSLIGYIEDWLIFRMSATFVAVGKGVYNVLD